LICRAILDVQKFLFLKFSIDWATIKDCSY
jgi:hypothetical protein